MIERFRPDVIHSHNLPDRLSVLAMELTGGAVPIVHDDHDLQCLRQTPYEDGFPVPENPLVLERKAVEGCNELVVVSEEMLDQLGARYRLPISRCFPNYALARDLPPRLPDPERPRSGPFASSIFELDAPRLGVGVEEIHDLVDLVEGHLQGRID